MEERVKHENHVKIRYLSTHNEVCCALQCNNVLHDFQKNMLSCQIGNPTCWIIIKKINWCQFYRITECYSMYIITYLFHNTTINWTHFKLFFILAHVKLYHRNKRYTNMVHIAFRHFPSAQSCFPNEYAKHNSIASAEIKEIDFDMSNLTSNLKLRTLLQKCVAWFLVFDWFSNIVIMRRV